MDNQTLMLGILAILVLVLTILLIRRMRSERHLSRVLNQMNPSDFSEFLRANSVDGVISTVAGRVSDFLKTVFGCEVIIFLRKKRRYLELNYFHGIRKFDRREFKLYASKNLTDSMIGEFMPRSLDELKDQLPEKYISKLKSFGVNMFFPVYWRDNCYGVYFIKSTEKLNSELFRIMIASLAQSLSAAYHIKWHEWRLEQTKAESDENIVGKGRPHEKSTNRAPSMLKLVLHRDSETLIGKLVGSIRTDLGMNRVALLYKNGRDTAKPRFICDGGNGKIRSVEEIDLSQWVQFLENGRNTSLRSLLKVDSEVAKWAESFIDQGYEFVCPFSLYPEQPGLLAWSGGERNTHLNERLQELHSHASDLVNNAESYRRVEELSYTDNLTTLANQRYFSRRLEEEIQRARRYKRKLTLVFADLDELKSINDRYGHLAGDSVLRQVGRILRKSIRSVDILARYGGDEFCIIMPESDAQTCAQFMDRLCKRVAKSKFSIEDSGEVLGCTISLGGAVFPDDAEGARELIKMADSALLQAKADGRNRALLIGSMEKAVE